MEQKQEVKTSVTASKCFNFLLSFYFIAQSCQFNIDAIWYNCIKSCQMSYAMSKRRSFRARGQKLLKIIWTIFVCTASNGTLSWLQAISLYPLFKGNALESNQWQMDSSGCGGACHRMTLESSDKGNGSPPNACCPVILANHGEGKVRWKIHQFQSSYVASD